MSIGNFLITLLKYLFSIIYICCMNVHFIAIGGAAMHNLALALHNKGYNITGSDDTIFDPSKSQLKVMPGPCFSCFEQI